MSGHILAQTPHSSAHCTSFASLLLEKQYIPTDSSLLQARMLEWIIHTSIKFCGFEFLTAGLRKMKKRKTSKRNSKEMGYSWNFPCVQSWVFQSQLTHWVWWLSWWCAAGYFSSELVMGNLALLFPGNLTVFKQNEILWQDYTHSINV